MAALLAAVVACQLALGIVYIRVRTGDPVRWPLVVVFWTAEAAGILMKGPAAWLVARHLSPPGEAVLSVGYSEPSLLFLLGTATRLATVAPGDRQLAGAGMALVGDREDAAFRKSLATRGLNLSAVDRVSGLDYSAGRGRVILSLYDLEPR
jgi:hypothetical protein